MNYFGATKKLHKQCKQHTSSKLLYSCVVTQCKQIFRLYYVLKGCLFSLVLESYKLFYHLCASGSLNRVKLDIKTLT